MRDPSTADEWIAVARERGEDATELLVARGTSVGPSYMAGYAIESALKAYLQVQGIARPTSGPAGHDLRALWKASGLLLRDLRDHDGSASFFIDEWTTALRYQIERPSDQHSSEALVKAATQLVGYLTNLTKRQLSKRRK